jgi:hypothetical protein
LHYGLSQVQNGLIVESVVHVIGGLTGRGSVQIGLFGWCRRVAEDLGNLGAFFALQSYHH